MEFTVFPAFRPGTCIKSKSRPVPSSWQAPLEQQQRRLHAWKSRLRLGAADRACSGEYEFVLQSARGLLPGNRRVVLPHVFCKGWRIGVVGRADIEKTGKKVMNTSSIESTLQRTVDNGHLGISSIMGLSLMLAPFQNGNLMLITMGGLKDHKTAFFVLNHRCFLERVDLC